MVIRTPDPQDLEATVRGAGAEDAELEEVEAVDEETVHEETAHGPVVVVVEERDEVEVKAMETLLLPNPQTRLLRANYRRSRSSLKPGKAMMMMKPRFASSAPTPSSTTRLRLATTPHATFAHCD